MKAGSRVDETSAALRSWLKNAEFKPGARIPSERRIASEFGKSHSAVNRAVARLVSEGVLIREGYKLYYSPGKRAEADGRPYMYVTGRVAPRIKLALRTSRILSRKIEVIIRDSVEALRLVLHRLQAEETAGVIFDVPFFTEVLKWRAGVESLLEANIPCVCVGQPVKDLSGVSPDYGAAVRDAFAHLVQMKHTELAFQSVEVQAPSVLEAAANWESQCHLHGMPHAAARVYRASQRSPRDGARVFADFLCKEWRQITGLIVHDRILAPHLVKELSARGRRVPADLSIICLGDTLQLSTSTPPISCLSFNEPLLMEMAFRLLDWISARMLTTGKMPAPESFKMQPHLILRRSTAHLGSPELSAPSQRKKPLAMPSEEWSDDPGRLRYVIEAKRRRPYPLTVGAGESRFRTLDLKRHLNRPLNYRLGWLGDLPLRNLGDGAQRIHGALFNIVNGPARSDFGAVVFRSQTNSIGFGKILPERIRVKVGCCAKAIYILHGCGLSSFRKEFARYNFYCRAGLIESVPVVVLGAKPVEVSAEEWDTALAEACIQDWWPDYYHTDFAHAKAMIVPQDEETMQSRRYLYTLEWVNPLPKEKIEYVEVCVDAKQSTTLGVLAMSVLKPEERL